MERYGSDASCRIAELINDDASPEERIYLATYYRYWFRPEIIQCLNGTEDTVQLEGMELAAEGWSHLYDHGYRYVVIDTLTHSSTLALLDLEQVPEWMDVATIFEDGPFVAYRLDSLDPERQSEMICVQVDPPAWEVISIDSY
jgi:hypothetical protein